MSSLLGFLLTLALGLSSLLIPSPAFAETNVNISNNEQGSSSNVSVNSTNNGTSTTCINGKCTTTGGDSHSTVCVNGKCTESTDGKVDMQSDDGKTQVHINNSTGNNQINQTTPEATITPEDKGDKKVLDAKTKAAEVKKQVEKQKAELKNKAAADHFNLVTFLKQQFSSLKRVFSFGILK